MQKDEYDGFSLIEILVVVIIIGILTSFAVSLYKRATYSSYFHTILPVAKAIHTSNEEFFLRNGYYAKNLADLTVNVPEQNLKNVQVQLKDTDDYSYVLTTREGLNNNYVLFGNHSKMFPQHVHCEAKQGDNLAVWLCEEKLHGTKVEQGGLTEGYTTYIVDGEEETGRYAIHYEDQSGIVLHDGDSCTASEKNSCQNVTASNAICTGNSENACALSEYDDESTCLGNKKKACSESTFTQSLCEANAQGGCWRSTFVDSECIATAGGDADSTSCGGKDREDSQSYYVRSLCKNLSKSGFACGRSVYEDYSQCISSTSGGCGKSSFKKYSVCEGWHSSACDRSKFYDHSICYAYVAGSCLFEQGTTYYDDTSYCAGKVDHYSFCPVGTPTKETGKTWRKCDSAHNDPQDKINAKMSCY